MPRIKSTPRHISALAPEHINISRHVGTSPPPPSPASTGRASSRSDFMGPEPAPADDLSVLPAAASTGRASSRSDFTEVRYRLRVRRRAFDSLREQFSRVIVAGSDPLHPRGWGCNPAIWASAVAELRECLLAGKAENDEALLTEGACDKVSIHTAADLDMPLPLGGWSTQMPLGDWLDSLVDAGVGPLSVVMGSSHHNASQWFIDCLTENPETAVTLVAMRAIPDWNSYQVTEHFDNIREAIAYIMQHYTPDGGAVSVLFAEGAQTVALPYPYGFEPADYSFFESAPLPLYMEAQERDAKLSFEITWTW